ncbi:YdhK family protein [Cohnella hashimotonis]|uniref:YdhK family protein n=1 Tax=Cohnella hashimotonis TaxID=2826895 RepID=A0ABT6TI68_9BACL|nr:YdhK family protein [Cohnella hashimotonis]MDI4646500.1 YdhK family protein [Cohnella hashimotonis]
MKKTLLILGVTATLMLNGCARGANVEGMQAMDHQAHALSTATFEGLKKASAPAFPVGSKVTIHSDHMEGMNGAEGTVSGAFDTTLYAVTYKPATGGKTVHDHKWVIQEELKDAGEARYAPGDSVTLNADHMEGMMGAAATIDLVVKGTVYSVDYDPTTGGDTVKNHRWVSEDELSAR